ncbi:MAG: hypothetical protein PHX62_02965 [Bacilli bacterium]|nr:hypothetical protein [Bacilli bacterium]
MKWSLQQLHKYNGESFTFSGTYNFEKEIENISDILGISNVEVEGVGQNLYDDDFKFDLKIRATLILEDARTLDPVDYPLNLEITEIYSPELRDDDTRLIEKNTIDLRPLVWEVVLLEKPIRFVIEKLPDN